MSRWSWWEVTILVAVAAYFFKFFRAEWAKVFDPEEYRFIQERRARNRAVFFPFLLIGAACMFIAPPLGLLVWIVGSAVVTFSRR